MNKETRRVLGTGMNPDSSCLPSRWIAPSAIAELNYQESCVRAFSKAGLFIPLDRDTALLAIVDVFEDFLVPTTSRLPIGRYKFVFGVSPTSCTSKDLYQTPRPTSRQHGCTGSIGDGHSERFQVYLTIAVAVWTDPPCVPRTPETSYRVLAQKRCWHRRSTQIGCPCTDIKKLYDRCDIGVEDETASLVGDGDALLLCVDAHLVGQYAGHVE